jgi:hypothetical protein
MAIGIDAAAFRSAAWRKTVVAVCLVSIIVMPLCYAALPPILTALDLDVKRERILPFRDETRYWIVPWKHTECSAETFARAALQEAGPNGIIICDSTSYYPLLLMRVCMQEAAGVAVEGYTAMARSDGSEPAALSALMSGRPVFMISPVLNCIPDEYRQDFILNKGSEGVLYRLCSAGQDASDM